MKEHPQANYLLSLSAIEEAISPRLGQLLPRTYRLDVNGITSIVVVPWLPASPWPPPYPSDWDHWRDRDEAAAYLFATHAVTIAPTHEYEPRTQTVVYDEYPDMAHTVFWLPKTEHESLLVDIERAYGRPSPSRLRLDELDEGPLAEFFRRDLPRASLSTYDRQILCLDQARE